MGLPLLFCGGRTYSYVPASAGVYVAGVAPTFAVRGPSSLPNGVYGSGVIAVSAMFNLTSFPAGVWASNPSDDQPTEFIPVLLGENPVGLSCRFGSVLRKVTMISIRNAFVPAITVCDSQVALRKLRTRGR